MKFQEKVWALLKKIPKGKVTSYKIIANKLGTRAYKAVGTACSKNPFITVPCHRVVNSNGCIGNYSGGKGIRTKIELLQKEGIGISGNKIVDFKKVLFKF